MDTANNAIISDSDITACLRMHLKRQRPVTLHNTYQGVPVRTEAEVAMVHEDFIGLIVHPYQAVCIKLARYTFVESKALPQLIRANPISIDYTNHVVMLKELKVPHAINVDLEHAWVTPHKPVEVDVRIKNKGQAMAALLEIAILGENRVRVVVAVAEDAPFARGDKASLAFQLEDGEAPLSVQGEVHSLIKLRNKDAKRLEVNGRAVMADEVSILAYIAMREDQILQGLDKAYKRLRKGKGIIKR